MKNVSKSQPDKFIASLAVVCLTSVFLLIFRILSSDSSRYFFMLWNLILAVIPVVLAWWLYERLKTKPWLSPKQLLITAGWLFFLPNSFYLVTDFVHLRQTFEVSLLYDVVLFTSFALSGIILGFLSLYLVHNELNKRLKTKQSWILVILLLLAGSFAIYLGRFSRWNTWDILLEPAGLLFDVSDTFVNPNSNSETYETTLIFLILLLPLYWLVWETANYLKNHSS